MRRTFSFKMISTVRAQGGKVKFPKAGESRNGLGDDSGQAGCCDV